MTDPALVRARQQAANLYPECSICRVSIMGGQWDMGSVVRQFITAPLDGIAELKEKLDA